jgi:hypothetical protein
VSIKGMRKEHFTQLLFYLKTCDEIGMYYGNQKQYLKRQDELKRWLQDIIPTTNSEGDYHTKMKDEIITKCICGKYHCPICNNQMEVYDDLTYKVFYASEFKRLEEEIKNLRCCGNCNLYSDGWCNTNQNEVYGDDLCSHYFAASREGK